MNRNEADEADFVRDLQRAIRVNNFDTLLWPEARVKVPVSKVMNDFGHYLSLSQADRERIAEQTFQVLREKRLSEGNKTGRRPLATI